MEKLRLHPFTFLAVFALAMLAGGLIGYAARAQPDRFDNEAFAEGFDYGYRAAQDDDTIREVCPVWYCEGEMAIERDDDAGAP